MKSIQHSLLILGLLLVLLSACAAPNVAPATEVSASPTALAMPTAMATEAATEAPASSAVQMPATSADLTGASLYQLSCASCHGQDRAGSTFTLDDQTIKVPALGWDDLSKLYTADPSRGSVPDQIGLAITKGQDETGSDMNAMMPRWSSLSQAQIDSLVQFIQAPGTGSASLSPAATNLTGEQLYVTSCAACHGVDGAGKTFTKDGQTIQTPSLHWADLSETYSKDPSRGSVADQVAISIVKGQDEEGSDLNAMMPRWSFLSKAQVDSLVQYLQTAFK